MKPMNAGESQHPISTPAVKDIKVRDNPPVKNQVLSVDNKRGPTHNPTDHADVFSGRRTKSRIICFKL